jgi:hypothetical protein
MVVTCPFGSVDDGLAATLWLTGPTGTAVNVNGATIGHFPLPGPLTVPPGSYELQASLRGYLPYAETIHLVDESEWLHWRVHLLPLSRWTSVTSNLLLAGLGQHYQSRPWEGYLFNVLEIGGLVTALIGELAFQNHRDDYLLLYAEYEQALTEADIDYYRAEAEAAYGKMEDAESLRETGLMVAAGAVVVSMLEAWLRFPALDAGPGLAPDLQTARTAGADPTLPEPAGRTGHVAPAAGSVGERLAAVHVGWRLRF